jgi:F420-dependent oxidoreductase-like protein
MKTAIGLGGPATAGLGGFERTVEFAVEAERIGVDSAWTAEAWGFDAVAPLAFVAARTSRIRLGTGIMQISARVPATTAATALTLDAITGGRFILGLGASGPQVVEGLHGRPFAQPMRRMRETIEIVRMAFRGEKLVYDGRHYTLPLPGGQGKALRLSHPASPEIPIHLATLSPRGLELTGEIADGWLGTSFTPEHADAHLRYLRAGAEKAGRSLADIDIAVGGAVAFGDDVDAMIEKRKAQLAFTLGAMGSATTNFYNDAYRRGGFEDDAIAVQKLWLEGKRSEAAARVPDSMVIQSNLLGTEDMVRERIQLYRDAGVDTLRLDPQGDSFDARIETLARAVALVHEVCG